MKFRYLIIALMALTLPAFARAEDPTPSTATKTNPGRWQICQASGGVTYDGKPSNRYENALLLDTETGKTWILWPTRDTPSGYSWIELSQRKDAPQAPTAP